MSKLHKILDVLDKAIKIETAYGHCDIPCGIYDPYAAQVAAHTVIRMDMLIADLVKSGGQTADDRNKMTRYIMIKEQHAEIVKHEIRVLWGDYFKPEHAKANPQLHTIVWDTLKAASKAKQSTNIADAEALLADVHKMAEAFWSTKNIATSKVKAPYPTEREMVLPKL
jgi:nickel superoxide dismutase